MLKGGAGGLVIEKEGKKLWVEIWRDFTPGEKKKPGDKKYVAVYFASIHGKSAQRLPFRGDICRSCCHILKIESQDFRAAAA